MGAAQIVMIGLFVASFTIALTKHGEPKDSNWSVWITSFAVAIHVGVLWWGGFWN